MNLSTISQLFGGKGAESGTTEAREHGSTLASSFADMIRTALGRRVDDESATKEVAVNSLLEDERREDALLKNALSEDEAALVAGDGAAFAPTALLLADASRSPAPVVEADAEPDAETRTAAGSPSAAEVTGDGDSAETNASQNLVPSVDMDDAANAGHASNDGRSFGPRSGSSINGVPQADIPVDAEPAADSSAPNRAEPDNDTRSVRPHTVKPGAPATSTSSSRTDASASDSDAPAAERTVPAGTDAPRGDSTTSTTPRTSADSEAITTSSGPSSGSNSESPDAGHMPLQPSTTAGAERAEPSAPVAAHGQSTGIMEAAAPSVPPASIEMTTSTGAAVETIAAETIAAELADIIESQGRAVVEAVDTTEQTRHTSAPSQPATKPEGGTAGRPFVVIDARTLSPEFDGSAEAADADDPAANLKADVVSGEVTTHDASPGGPSIAPEPTAVPPEAEQSEARSAEKSTPSSTVAVPIRGGEGSPAGGDDSSDHDRGNQSEPITPTPAEDGDFPTDAGIPPDETAVDAPKEIADEASLRSEDPVQTHAHRTADAAVPVSRAGQTAPAGRASMQAAWLRAMMEQAPGAVTTAAGWSSLTVSLDNNDGTMTVEARRDERQVAVQVSFSDPNLRSVAAQNIERLEAALRAQYDASVDLSLTSDGQGGAANGETSDGHPAQRHTAAQEPASAARTARTVPLGATREWVG